MRKVIIAEGNLGRGDQVLIPPKLPVSVDASSTHLIVSSCQYLEALYAELP